MFFSSIQPIIHWDSVKREQTMNNASGCNTADDNVTTMTTMAATTAIANGSGGNNNDDAVSWKKSEAKN